jgi:hypothetical protein
MKEKRFSFFANPQKRKVESYRTFGIFAFAPTAQANAMATLYQRACKTNTRQRASLFLMLLLPSLN